MAYAKDPSVVACAEIDPPPGMQVSGGGRVSLFLKPSDDGRYRWYREDGSATVVEALSVEGARRAAEFAWRRWNLHFEQVEPPG